MTFEQSDSAAYANYEHLRRRNEKVNLQSQSGSVHPPGWALMHGKQPQHSLAICCLFLSALWSQPFWLNLPVFLYALAFPLYPNFNVLGPWTAKSVFTSSYVNTGYERAINQIDLTNLNSSFLLHFQLWQTVQLVAHFRSRACPSNGSCRYKTQWFMSEKNL